MNNLKTEPMEQSNQVHTTTDYFLFKPIEGNRNKNLLHIMLCLRASCLIKQYKNIS